MTVAALSCIYILFTTHCLAISYKQFVAGNLSHTTPPENQHSRRNLTNYTQPSCRNLCHITSPELIKLQSTKMGLSINSNPPTMATESHNHTHKVFLFCNYILLGAASSCIFLTLSLRLFPSICGFFFILLHIFTIAGAISGCAAASSSGSSKWYAAHMVSTVLTAIFQGSVSVLIFTRTGDFLGNLKSYVREEDGAVILKLAGGLCILIFCLEWVVLTLAFFLKYYAYVEGDGGNGSSNAMRRSAKVGHEDEMKDWSWPYQVQV